MTVPVLLRGLFETAEILHRHQAKDAVRVAVVGPEFGEWITGRSGDLALTVLGFSADAFLLLASALFFPSALGQLGGDLFALAALLLFLLSVLQALALFFLALACLIGFHFATLFFLCDPLALGLLGCQALALFLFALAGILFLASSPLFFFTLAARFRLGRNAFPLRFLARQPLLLAPPPFFFDAALAFFFFALASDGRFRFQTFAFFFGATTAFLFLAPAAFFLFALAAHGCFGFDPAAFFFFTPSLLFLFALAPAFFLFAFAACSRLSLDSPAFFLFAAPALFLFTLAAGGRFGLEPAALFFLTALAFFLFAFPSRRRFSFGLLPRGRLDTPLLLFFTAAPQFFLFRRASRFFSGTGRALFFCLDLPAFGFLFREDSLAFFFGAPRLLLFVLSDALFCCPARQLLFGAETLLANPLPLFLFLTPQGLFFEALTLGFGVLPFGCLCREPLKLCFFRRVLLVLLRLHGEWHVHDDRHGLWGRGLGRIGADRAITFPPLER